MLRRQKWTSLPPTRQRLPVYEQENCKVGGSPKMGTGSVVGALLKRQWTWPTVPVPFFGGVPATAAIARTSVGIKSGGKTRVVSIIHSLVLLLADVPAAEPVTAAFAFVVLAGMVLFTVIVFRATRAA